MTCFQLDETENNNFHIVTEKKSQSYTKNSWGSRQDVSSVTSWEEDIQFPEPRSHGHLDRVYRSGRANGKARVL